VEIPTPTTPCYDGQLSLANSTYSYTVNGSYFYGGRVEVCYNGTYGPVCDEGWTDNDAAVVCMNMGYNSPYYRHEATRGMVFGLSDETPVLQNLMCNGTEYYLSDCSGYELGDVTGDYCLSGNDQAGIRCVEIPTPTTPCYDGQLTLENYTNSYTVNGSFFYGGRVEVCYNGTYQVQCVMRDGLTTKLESSATTMAITTIALRQLEEWCSVCQMKPLYSRTSCAMEQSTFSVTAEDMR
jgi:hypothetical protein